MSLRQAFDQGMNHAARRFKLADDELPEALPPDGTPLPSVPEVPVDDKPLLDALAAKSLQQRVGPFDVLKHLLGMG